MEHKDGNVKDFSNGYAKPDTTHDSVLLPLSSKDGTENYDYIKHDGIKQPKSVWLVMVAMYFIYFAYGLCNSTEGPSLPEMEYVLNTTTAGLSLGLAGSSVGFLVGCGISAVTLDRGAQDLQIALIGFFMAIATVLPPYSGSLIGYIGTLFFKGATAGSLCPGAQAYLLMILSGHRLQGTALQAMNLIWSAGATVGPFIIQSFIANNRSYIVLRNNTNTSLALAENFTNPHTNLSGIDHNNYSSKSQIGVAFVIIGVMTLLLDFPLLFLSLTRIYCGYNKQEQSSGCSEDAKSDMRMSSFHGSKLYLFGLLAMLTLWFKACIWSEITMGQFVATWVTKELKWSFRNGSFLTSTFFACHCAGRVIGVFLSVVCSPRTMLIMCASLASVGFLSLLTLNKIHFVIIWISVGTIGLGVSCAFPTMILWASGHIRISGKVSVLFLLGNSLGKITVYPLTGFLMQKYSPNWMLYLGTGSTICGLFLFIVLELYVKYCPKNGTSNYKNRPSKQI